MLESTLTALDRYAQVRNQFCARTTSSSFFVSMAGTRVIYRIVQHTFRRLCDSAGIGADAASPPRIHDLRHSFAVGRLLRWYRDGGNPADHLMKLSTFMGHVDPISTAVYLTITTDLMEAAGLRFERFAAPISTGDQP